MKCPIAHVRLGGADVIAVAFDKSFGQAPQDEQQQTIQDIQLAAKECRIGGQVVPVWEDENGRTMFLAPSNYHAALKDISVDSVWRNLNREIPIKKTPHLRKEDTGRTAKADAEKDEEEEKETGPLRSLTHEDIGKVLLAFREVGAEKFEKSFVQSQTIVERKPGSSFKPVMKEYYISLDKLRKPLFSDVDLRLSGQMFNDLSLSLDQCMLRCLGKNTILDEPFSLNLNIQTVLTQAFTNFIEKIPKGLLTLEFRQPNIVEYYDEFMAARSILQTNEIKLALDHVLPDAIGLVNVVNLNFDMAKIYWSSNAHKMLMIHRDRLNHLMSHDIEVVLVHVDEPSALTVGGELAIEQFQGFFLDEVLQ